MITRTFVYRDLNWENFFKHHDTGHGSHGMRLVGQYHNVCYFNCHINGNIHDFFSLHLPFFILNIKVLPTKENFDKRILFIKLDSKIYKLFISKLVSLAFFKNLDAIIPVSLLTIVILASVSIWHWHVKIRIKLFHWMSWYPEKSLWYPMKPIKDNRLPFVIMHASLMTKLLWEGLVLQTGSTL